MRLLLALAFAAALRLESPGIAVLAALVNQSIDDTDPSIVYLPSKFWHASTLPCETCLNPPNASAFLKTWHDGTHIIPNADEDDEGANGPDTDGDIPSGSGSSSSRSSSSTHSASSSTVAKSTSLPTTPSPAATTAAAAATDTDDDDDGHKGKGDHPDRRRRRRPLAIRDGGNPFEVPTDDSDDPGFQDVNATMTLNFTGSAIYLYALLPLYASPANTTPTFVNLSFALDNTSLPDLHYIHTGTALPSSLASLFATTPLTNTGQPGDPLLNPALPKNNATFFQYSALVFSMGGLDDTDGQDAPHSLTVNVGPNSVFLFDYALVTTTEANSTSGSNTTTAAQGVASRYVSFFLFTLLHPIPFDSSPNNKPFSSPQDSQRTHAPVPKKNLG